MENTAKGTRQKRRLSNWNNQKLKTILIALSFVLAWFAGNQLQTKTQEEILSFYFPYWKIDKKLSAELTSLSKDGSSIYVVQSQSNGFGGPLSVILAINDSIISKVIVSDHKETPSYIAKVFKSELFHSFDNKNIKEVILAKPDAISGATKSAKAFINATISASKTVAKTIYQIDVADDSKPAYKIGLAEFVIIILYCMAILSWYLKPKIRKVLHTISLFISVIFLGFVFDQQITISTISSLLNGYIPDWQSNMPIYLLLLLLALSLLIWNKNTYCEWVCPFGAAQNILGKIGNAKACPARKSRKRLNLTLSFIVWAALIVSLLFQNPGIISYEVFNGLFRLTGTTLLFILLIVSLILSLFIKRPWCSYLCPITPSVKYFQSLRKLFNLKRNETKATH